VGASADALGFLLASGGLHTASDSRSLYLLLDPQVTSVTGIAIFNSFLDYSLLFSWDISRLN